MKTTKQPPLVSVIMNCYNGEKYLAEAIESVLNQTYKNFEIIFWDNVSTDKSANIVTSYNDDRIKYFLAKKHTPLGKARNGALQKVRGAYIAFLDVDDLWLPKKLEKQIPLFDNSKVGLVYSETNNINSSGKVINSVQAVKGMSNVKITLPELLENYNIVFSSAVISKEALIFVGGCFDSLLKHAEEYDLFLRISLDFEAVILDETLTKYRIHEGQDSLKNFEISILEDEYIISKIKVLYPNLMIKHTKLLNKKKEYINWCYFLNFILRNKTTEARSQLRPYIFKSFKSFSFYFLSFLGTKPIINLWKHKRRKKGKSFFTHKTDN